ncbi:MAG: uL30 family ribosomal protein [Cyanobacteria bacterium]|nr:uL30 family ribosomal protein [Cyanobacteriota bacterium]
MRGRVNVRNSIAETMNRLNLKRVNNCILLKSTDVYYGMLKKCENYIAYGEVDELTLTKLFKKYKLNVDPKGLINSSFNIKDIKDKMPFRLHPPKHGYKNVMIHYRVGGSVGYMGAEINKLVNRML